MLKHETWERFSQISSSIRYESHVGGFEQEMSQGWVFVDLHEDITKVVLFKSEFTHFFATSAHLLECFAKGLQADETDRVQTLQCFLDL